MKTTHLLKTAVLTLCVAISHLALALGGGSIMGQVKDPDTELPVAGIKVVLESQGSSLVFETNENGYYYASNIPPGVYSITVSYMKNVTTVPGIKIGNDEAQNIDLNISLLAVTTLDTVEIVGIGKNTLINPFEVDRKKLSAIEVRQLPVQKIVDILPTLGSGAVEVDGKVFVRGARPEGLAYYIDGCKIMGNPNVPICGVEMMQIYTGYVPAKWGDSLSGIVAIETRNFFTE